MRLRYHKTPKGGKSCDVSRHVRKGEGGNDSADTNAVLAPRSSRSHSPGAPGSSQEALAAVGRVRAGRGPLGRSVRRLCGQALQTDLQTNGLRLPVTGRHSMDTRPRISYTKCLSAALPDTRHNRLQRTCSPVPSNPEKPLAHRQLWHQETCPARRMDIATHLRCRRSLGPRMRSWHATPDSRWLTTGPLLWSI